MFKFNLDEHKYKKIHFIGIGGISMSGIAHLLAKNGYTISGSDRSESDTIEHLKTADIEIFIGQRKENISNQDLFIYTDAILPDNEELIAAKGTGKEVVTRGMFLGALMRNYKKSIAVSGSHGKSTTTSMISKILLDTNSDASILLGGMLDEMDGNVRVGSSDFLLTEACEFKGNILYYYPSTVIVLNLDADHLDYYKNLDHIVETFIGYMKNLDEDSKAIINIDDEKTHRLLEHIKGKVLSYGMSENAMYRISNVEVDDYGHPSFDLTFDNQTHHFELQILGNYNVYNACASIIASVENGIDIEKVKSSIKNYKSLHRRMEVVGKYNDAVIMTDYGHHPQEIIATLKTLKELKKKDLVVVFQPHTYSRTKALLNEFANAFYDADEVIVTEIFAARENFDPTIKSEDLVDKLIENNVNARYIKDFESAKEYIINRVHKGDTLLTTGCGNPHELAKMIVS